MCAAWSRTLATTYSSLLPFKSTTTIKLWPITAPSQFARLVSEAVTLRVSPPADSPDSHVPQSASKIFIQGFATCSGHGHLLFLCLWPLYKTSKAHTKKHTHRCAPSHYGTSSSPRHFCTSAPRDSNTLIAAVAAGPGSPAWRPDEATMEPRGKAPGLGNLKITGPIYNSMPNYLQTVNTLMLAQPWTCF